jgi:hypothetical protein
MPHICESICESVSVGDIVRLIATPEQTGIVTQKDKMRFCNLVVLWNQGPVYNAGLKSLLICHLGEVSIIELLP